MERRTTTTKSTGLGMLLIAVGIGAMLADFSLEGSGRVAVVVGAMLACFQKLDRRLAERTKAMNEQFQVGYDLGIEDGFKQGHTTARPVVVPLTPARCASCQAGREEVLSTVGSVADRG